MPPSAAERSLPQNLEAERSILGAILLDNEALSTAVEKLHPTDFFDTHHRRIYESMLELSEKQSGIDLVTLTEALQRNGDLENAGGAAYVAQLMDGMPRLTNVEHYARIVREKSILRGLIHSAAAIQQQALAAEEDADTILYRAAGAMAQLADQATAAAMDGIQPIRAVVEKNLEAIEKLLTSPRGVTGLPSGYQQLDELLAGLHPGNVIILAARPSIGKTALALNIAENVARRGTGVAMFSLEMSREEILQRLAASKGRINLHAMRGGGMSAASWSHVRATLDEIAAWPLFIDDANPTNAAEITAKTRALKRKEAIGLVIVDYLQLVSGLQGKFTNRNEEVGASSRAFKAMARSLYVPVIVLSQLTRASEREERRPQLSDLRESGAIEQDADVVLFIHRPKAFAIGEPPDVRNVGEVIVAKQRNGPTEAVKFVFLSSFARYEEMAPEMWSGSEQVRRETRDPGDD